MLAPGSSLGGTRPKASVRDRDGHLAVAKFPHKGDEIHAVRWEAVALSLAAKAGISVPVWRIEDVAGKLVLLLRRFDRAGTVPTAIDLEDGTASLERAIEVAGYFELEVKSAAQIAAEVGQAVATWRTEAARLGLTTAEIDRMASAFEHDDLRASLKPRPAARKTSR